MNADKKYSMEKFGKKCYLLGADKNGINYFLEEATWDCDWYWGGGYVETYTSNRNPKLARDIASHQHFDSLFFKGNKCSYDVFKEFFVVCPFTNDEIWKILELMKSFYTARAYSDMIHRGGSHFTQNPCSDTIHNEDEYKRINEVIIPNIMKELYSILEG